MQSRVHCLVQNRGGDFGVREIRIDRESQLHQAGSLLMEVRPPAGESLNDNVGEVPFQMAKVMRHVLFDQPERPLQSREHILGLDVGTRVVHDDRNPTHLVMRKCGGCQAYRELHEKSRAAFPLGDLLPQPSVGDHRFAIDGDCSSAQLRRKPEITRVAAAEPSVVSKPDHYRPRAQSRLFARFQREVSSPD